MSGHDNLEKAMRSSLLGLDGFSVAVTPLPYEFEEFNLEISSRKLQEQMQNLVQEAGIKTLTSDEYSAADAPGSLGITIEMLKTERDTYIYCVRALVTQLAVLERDIKRQAASPTVAITWMSPRLRVGEVSTSIYIERISQQMTAVTNDFIEAFKLAQTER